MGICLSVKAEKTTDSSLLFLIPHELRCIFERGDKNNTHICILYDAEHSYRNKKWRIVFSELDGSFTLQKYLRGKPVSTVKSGYMNYDDSLLKFSGNITYKHIHIVKEFTLSGKPEQDKVTFTLVIDEEGTTTYFAHIIIDQSHEENEKSPKLSNNL